MGVQSKSTYAPVSTFESCNLELVPNSNCKTEVRSVHSGGTFFVVRLWQKHQAQTEELYVKYSTPKLTQTLNFKQISINDSNPFYLLDYRSAIETFKLGNCFEVVHVYCTQSFVILQMRNNLILAFEATTGNCLFSDKFEKTNTGIREIIVGPLSCHLLIYGSDNMLYYFNADASSFKESSHLNLNFKNRKYVKSALSGRSTFVVYENEDKSHHIFSHGDDQFLVQSGEPSVSGFTKLETPFNGKRINQIKCGYFHTCVLLENGEVWTCGYNAYSQCGVNGSDQRFTKLEFPSFPLECKETNEKLYESNSRTSHIFQPTSIACSSIATVFINKYGFIIVGDPVSTFTKKYTFKLYEDARTVDCIYYAFGEKEFGIETNIVEAGGWHFVVYKKKSIESKCLKYLLDNMTKITQIPQETFSDVTLLYKH